MSEKGELHAQEPNPDWVLIAKDHREWHTALDRLMACYFTETGRLFSETTVMDLAKWSNEAMKEAEARAKNK